MPAEALREDVAAVADMICSSACLISCRFFCVAVADFGALAADLLSGWFLAVVFLSIKPPWVILSPNVGDRLFSCKSLVTKFIDL